MKTWWIFTAILLIFCVSPQAASAQAAGNIRGWCEAGAQPVITSGLKSTTLVQASYPKCQIEVFVHGGGIATIYKDESSTPLSNPFTADDNGQWLFYSAVGGYDITMSGAEFPAPVTYSNVILLSSATSGGPPAGAVGDFQEKASSLAFGVAPLHDTGTQLQATKPLDPTQAENFAQKPNPSIQYVDAAEGSVSLTDGETQGTGANLYFENAWFNLWAYRAFTDANQSGTIYLNAPGQQHINLNSLSTTPNGTYVMRIIGPGDPNYATDCSSTTLPTCMVGGQIWYKVPRSGVRVICISGSYSAAAIASNFGNPCILNFATVISGVGSQYAADGLAYFGNTRWPGLMVGYSSNGIYGDPAMGNKDAPQVQNSYFTSGNGPGPWQPPLAFTNLDEAKFTNDFYWPTSFEQTGYEACTISSVTRSANVATFTCSAAHNFPSQFFGSSLFLPVRGVTDTTFNQYGVVTVVDGTHLSMPNNGPAATSSGGVIYGPASYAVYAPGNPSGGNENISNKFENVGLKQGGILVSAQNGNGVGASPISLQGAVSEGLPLDMAAETSNAFDYSGGLDNVGNNLDSDQTCNGSGLHCGGSAVLFGQNGSLSPGIIQAMNDSISNGQDNIPVHSHFRAYSSGSSPGQSPEIRDASGFWNGDVRASWPGLNRSGAPLQVLYANQCATTPGSWTGSVSTKPSYLDVTSSGIGAGQVTASVTFCASSQTFQNGDRILVGAALNAQSAAGYPAGNVTMQLTIAGTNCWLYESNGIEGGGLSQNYVFSTASGQGDWWFAQKWLKIYTGAGAESCTLTFTGTADGSHIMQYAFPKIEVIPAADALTDDEVAQRARYEPLFSSACAVGLCDPKTGIAVRPGSPIVFNHSGTQTSLPHIVQDHGTLSGGTLAVTLTGSSVFTANTTFSCSANDTTTPANAVVPTLTSGSSITFTGTGTDVFSYSCSGN